MSSGLPNGLAIVLWLLPLVAGLVLGLAKPAAAIGFVNRASDWWEGQYQSAASKSGFFTGVLWRWLIWGIHKLHGWTAGIADDAVRAGVRAAMFFYIAGLSVFLMLSAIYLAIAIALLVIGFWVLGKVFELGSDQKSDTPTYRRPSPSAARDGQSRKRRDFWGDEYTEHTNADGERTGTSRERKDWLGDSYVERRGTDGEVQETARERKDWLGDEYTEHRASGGEKSGESRSKKDWLGDEYVEHRDADGDEAGRSEERRDWLGERYTEHKKKD